MNRLFHLRRRSEPRRGISLTELSVSMLVGTLVVATTTQQYFQMQLLVGRTRQQEIVSLQIDPLKNIFQTHVNRCRYALFSSLQGAENNDLTQVVASNSSTTSPEFALRCTLRDGQGVFIIYWEGPTATADGTVYLTTGTQSGSTQTAWNDSIPLTRALSTFAMDISQGFVQVTCSIPGRLYTYDRTTMVSNTPQIPYTFVVESTQN